MQDTKKSTSQMRDTTSTLARTASTTSGTVPTTRTAPRCGPAPRPRSWRRCATSRSACSAWPAGPTSSGPPRRCPAASARPSPSSASSPVEQKGGDHNTATLAKALGEVLPVVRRGAAAGRGTRCADTASRRSARAANAKISIAASHGGLPYLLHDATRDRALRLIQLRRRSRGGGVR